MSQQTSLANDPAPAEPASRKALSRQPLTPEQQMDALKRVQGQAEQRVKLGMQLFKAAEARLSNHSDVLQQIKRLQHQLREQVNDDVAKSLHSYDQWIGQIDESFTKAIRRLDEKVDDLQTNMVKSEARITNLLNRTEALLDQSRCMLDQQNQEPPQATAAPAQAHDETASRKAPAQDNRAQANDDQKGSPGQITPDPHGKIYSTLLKRLIEGGPHDQGPAGKANAA